MKLEVAQQSKEIMPSERALTPSSSQHHESNGDYIQRRRRLRRERNNNPFHDLDNSKCAKCLTKIVCKIPCVIVCGIVGGDTYLLFGYSRLVLMEEIGTILTTLALAIYGVCVSLLLSSYFRCMLTSCAVEDNPPPPDFDGENCPKCEKCGNWKPPRTHHCSLCGTCTLKMDHHCM